MMSGRTVFRSSRLHPDIFLFWDRQTENGQAIRWQGTLHGRLPAAYLSVLNR